MIRWYSMVRIKKSGRLGFICDFDSDVHGDPRDPSCVRVAALFGPGSKRAEWDRIECFLEDIIEVREAEGAERRLVCSDFEYLLIDSFWSEDSPPEEHCAIRVAMEEDGASIWLEHGFAGPVDHIAHLAPSKVRLLKAAIDKAGIWDWKRYYDRGDLRIGSNAWEMTFIRGDTIASTGGDDGYPADLERMCRDLRSVGLPVAFWDGHGLAVWPLREKKRRGPGRHQNGN